MLRNIPNKIDQVSVYARIDDDMAYGCQGHAQGYCGRDKSWEV